MENDDKGYRNDNANGTVSENEYDNDNDPDDDNDNDNADNSNDIFFLSFSAKTVPLCAKGWRGDKHPPLKKLFQNQALTGTLTHAAHSSYKWMRCLREASSDLREASYVSHPHTINNLEVDSQ